MCAAQPGQNSVHTDFQVRERGVRDARSVGNTRPVPLTISLEAPLRGTRDTMVPEKQGVQRTEGVHEQQGVQGGHKGQKAYKANKG